MSKKILIIGAGRSSAALIKYLSEISLKNGWSLTVGDQSETTAKEAAKNFLNVQSVLFDISDLEKSAQTIQGNDLVVSLLPAHLHIGAAKLCLKAKAHLITASYVSDEMRAFNQAAIDAGLLFLNECGLDPGIDHMSALEVINRIKNLGGEITSFRSFTGGLIAPSTDRENPWRYKFTWNARNVVMAGQGFATYQENGKLKRIPYQQLFTRTVPVEVPGTGFFDGYANRDSLKYIDTYGLKGIQTMLRGTLRYQGYCQAWNILVQLGCCEDNGEIKTEGLTHREFIELFLPSNSDSTEFRIAQQVGVAEKGKEMEMIKWVGLLDDTPIGLEKGTPAQILEHILNKKWKLNPGDLDQIVMWHQFNYVLNQKHHEIQCSLVVDGIPNGATAMAQTVGIPMGIATRLILEGKISLRGVQIPVLAAIYEPILEELKTLGIQLHEYQIS